VQCCRRTHARKTQQNPSHHSPTCVRAPPQSTLWHGIWLSTHTVQAHTYRARGRCVRTHNKSAHLSRARLDRALRGRQLPQQTCTSPPTRATSYMKGGTPMIWGGSRRPPAATLFPDVCTYQCHASEQQSNGRIQPTRPQRAANADSMCAAAVCSFSATVQSCSRRERLPATCIGGGRWKATFATGAGRMSSSSTSSSSSS